MKDAIQIWNDCSFRKVVLTWYAVASLNKVFKLNLKSRPNENIQFAYTFRRKCNCETLKSLIVDRTLVARLNHENVRTFDKLIENVCKMQILVRI